jgi:hypothetical protein
MSSHWVTARIRPDREGPANPRPAWTGALRETHSIRVLRDPLNQLRGKVRHERRQFGDRFDDQRAVGAPLDALFR